MRSACCWHVVHPATEGYICIFPCCNRAAPAQACETAAASSAMNMPAEEWPKMSPLTVLRVSSCTDPRQALRGRPGNAAVRHTTSSATATALSTASMLSSANSPHAESLRQPHLSATGHSHYWYIGPILHQTNAPQDPMWLSRQGTVRDGC